MHIFGQNLIFGTNGNGMARCLGKFSYTQACTMGCLIDHDHRVDRGEIKLKTYYKPRHLYIHTHICI